MQVSKYVNELFEFSTEFHVVGTYI